MRWCWFAVTEDVSRRTCFYSCWDKLKVKEKRFSYLLHGLTRFFFFEKLWNKRKRENSGQRLIDQWIVFLCIDIYSCLFSVCVSVCLCLHLVCVCYGWESNLFLLATLWSLNSLVKFHEFLLGMVIYLELKNRSMLLRKCKHLTKDPQALSVSDLFVFSMEA